MEKYKPNPIDTSGVELSKEILDLTEMIAKNVHEVWALNRQSEGWIYGAKKDDVRKTSPCMVPYEALPESEKEYDRNTAMETIKLILLFGYTINKAVEGDE